MKARLRDRDLILEVPVRARDRFRANDVSGFALELHEFMVVVAGVKPPPNAWKNWDLNLLETDQMKSLQEDRTHQLKIKCKLKRRSTINLKMERIK